MNVSRVMLLVGAVSVAAASVATAQGRGNGPAARGPHVTRGGSGPNASGGGGHAGKGQAGGGAVGRGKSGEARGDSGGRPPEAGGNAGDGGRGGRGNARRQARTTNDDSGANPRGRRGPGQENGASFLARMNPRQRARLEAMLPSGMTLEQAADGFRNRGQFVAALQQSDKHNVSFVDLKSEMTGDVRLSLGQAMRKLRVETDED